MKKPSEVPLHDQDVASLKLRVASLERTCAAMGARMLALFGPAAKAVDVARPANPPAAR